MNNITIELSAEDRALLNRIAENLEALKGNATPKTEPKIEPQKPEKVKAPTNAQPEEKKATQPETVAQDKQEDNVPEVTLDDIRQVVVKLATTGKKAEARAIVNKYAKSVGEIPADKIGEAFKELKAVMLGE